MRWLVFLILLVIAGCAQLVYAEQIPASTKSKIETWVLGGPEEDFGRALQEMSERGIIKLTGHGATYALPSYGQTAFVDIAGRTGNPSQTSPVTLTVVAPDGTATEYTVPVLESGAYHTVIPISHESQKGAYKVIAYHAGKKLPDSFFYVGHPGVAVPRWVTSTAKWWLEGKITDSDFVSGLDFLIKNKIIQVTSADSSRTALDVIVEGHKAVRRGTAQEILVRVEDAHGPVDGAYVSVRVEDYGEKIFEEFEGFTDSGGSYIISWEISSDFENLKKFLVYIDVTDGLSSKSKLFTFEVYCLCGEPNCKCRT